MLHEVNPVASACGDTRRIVGSYRREPAIHYLDPQSGLNLFTTAEGGFWGAWRLSRVQIENVVRSGSLR
jgi:hypothetical protein